MSERGGAVHVVTTRRTYKGRVYETHLLRRSYREGDRVKNETLGNLSHLPAPVIDLVRRVLRGETFVPVAERLEVLGSRPHGHVQAVRLAMQRLGIESLIGTRPSPERDRILALIAARVLAPHTKLATTRWWHTSTLAEEFGVSSADEDDLYAAMDWLLERQPAIERKLAAKHFGEGSLALYDLSSSYFEGTHCPLGKIGYSRDGKKNKLQVNYGLMTTREGCPISVSVYEGNTSDTKTLLPQVTKLKESFGLERVVLVGDRGMISHKAIGELKDIDGMAWITALKSGQIRGLIEAGALQLGLFDERNLFEFSDPKYPDERLIACRNPQLAKLRAHKRQALLEATRLELDKIRDRVARGALEGAAAIGVKLGRVLDKYKVGKHFELTITDTAVKYQILEPQVAAEAALDGIYVIRTGLPKKQMSAPDAVRSYKALTQVERAFRSLKTVDLKIRPITPYSETDSSRPVAAAALAIPDLAALIFSAYCSGIRVDFHPPACVIAAKSMSSSARSCAAPTLVECPLTSATNLAGIPIHRATRLKIGAMLPGCSASPISSRPINRRNIGPSAISACSSQIFSHFTVSRER
jgi:hypothetical protein